MTPESPDDEEALAPSFLGLYFGAVNDVLLSGARTGFRYSGILALVRTILPNVGGWRIERHKNRSERKNENP